MTIEAHSPLFWTGMSVVAATSIGLGWALMRKSRKTWQRSVGIAEMVVGVLAPAAVGFYVAYLYGCCGYGMYDIFEAVPWAVSDAIGAGENLFIPLLPLIAGGALVICSAVTIILLVLTGRQRRN